jgi:hypothetical protein
MIVLAVTALIFIQTTNNMAKRFIDTGLFDDSWFMGLSKDAKLLWLYLITKCDHAGIIDFNDKLCRVQTGIEKIDDAFKQLGDRCLTVRERYRFIPKFIYFQYPNFPNSNARAQNSAISRLMEFNLIEQLDNGILTLSKELPNSYGYGKGNDTGINGKGGVGGKPEISWRNDYETYKNDLRVAYGEIINDSDWIKLQERLNPGVDIKLTIEKACINFWSTEAGWKHKKNSKAKTLDWKQTLTNSLTMQSNKVYIQNHNGKQKNEILPGDTRYVSNFDGIDEIKL